MRTRIVALVLALALFGGSVLAQSNERLCSDATDMMHYYEQRAWQYTAMAWMNAMMGDGDDVAYWMERADTAWDQAGLYGNKVDYFCNGPADEYGQ